MTIADFEQVTNLFEKTVELAEARAEYEAYEAEQANPTSYPLPDPWSSPSITSDTIKASLAELGTYFTKPNHYNDTAITALAVIDDWQANFRIGNALKYLARYQKKGTPIQDLEKCIEYVRLEIERLKAE